MIEIKVKEDCVGCNSCVQRCPKQCIAMHEDEQGFLYPMVDVEHCIKCGLCEKVCPVISQAEPHKPEKAYAAKNPDTDTLMNSSSGGIFFALAKSIIDEGGVVFGAKFNDRWEVVHDFAETLEDIHAFQTSKYVQSRIGNTFKDAENFLKDGRTVLFTGTPCQITGLKLFLRKPYDNLFAVDVACHGVPSPLVWREYLEYITRPEGVGKNTDFQSTLKGKMPVITGINFRDKRLGWEKYGFSVHAVACKGDKNSDSQSTIEKTKGHELLFEPFGKNLYMQIFLKNLDLRPSCYACPSKCGKSHSDITLADFWGIQKKYPILYEEGFYSLVLVGTKNGRKLLSRSNVEFSKVDIKPAIDGNPAIVKSPHIPKQYYTFWSRYNIEGLKCTKEILVGMKPPLVKRTSTIVLKVLSYGYHIIFKHR